jgi:6-phosphogluconolactonase
MSNFELLSFASADELARAAALAWLDEIESANRAGKPHCVALSGGRIAQQFFAATVEQAKARAVSFERVHFFWSDERCVPPTSPDSNFKLANEILLEPLNISPEKIHRLRGEDFPKVAVKSAEAELERSAAQDKNGQPVLDLIFLGMGEDGHVASLFPEAGQEALDCGAPYVAVINAPKPPAARISLSYMAIAAALEVWVLVSGAGKAGALREALTPGGQTPLAYVLRLRAKTKILSDLPKFA